MRSESSPPERTVRAVYRVCAVPGASAPYDRIHLKIHYPALPDGGEEQRNAGVVPADTRDAPYPVLVMMPGINVGPEAYAWLARKLALRGVVTVTYSLIAEEMPGYVSLTPGLDLAAITPETWGTRPSGTAIGPILEALARENAGGVLEGRIDTGKLVLGGHSAGGSAAMYNARADWFPGIRGAMAYGAHAAASTALGFDQNTVLDLANDVPVLLIGGTNDGVIAASATRYGDAGGEAPDRLRQTFDQGIVTHCGASRLIYIDGANHFSVAHPADETTGRGFLDGAESDGVAIRELLAELFEAFILDVCGGGNRIGQFEHHALVSTFMSR